MLTINYFASIREALGRPSETVQVPTQIRDVRGLIDLLVQERPEQWAMLKDEAQVLVAINQTIVDRRHPLKGDEEVAFFPPMTGG